MRISRKYSNQILIGTVILLIMLGIYAFFFSDSPDGFNPFAGTAVLTSIEEKIGTQPKWTLELPQKSCTNSPNHNKCYRGSPAVADINGDGKDDIILVTHNGFIVVVTEQDGKGVTLWETDVAPHFNMSAGQEEINSSPAVADIDQDGLMEIIVGVGGMYPEKHCAQGGIIVLEHDGSVKPGWPLATQDRLPSTTPCRDTIFSSPALGDLDLDGDLEIVIGGFDHQIYVLHHDGSFVDGFPINSALYDRFHWTDLRGQLGGPIWSSPAIADLDGDGYPEIIIGTSEGNFDNSLAPSGNSNWDCPYELPPGEIKGKCGGSLYAINRKGEIMPGFPIYFKETIQSSPVVFDYDTDGKSEIFVGTGDYYYRNSPDHPEDEFRIYAFNYLGEELVAWDSVLNFNRLSYPASSSPVIGNVWGSPAPEIIIAGANSTKGEIYVYEATGERAIVPYFRLTESFDNGRSFVLANTNQNNYMEIIFNHAGKVNVFDANNNTNTLYDAGGLLLNNPAVGDLDGDGDLELIAHNSTLRVWDLPGTTESAWPMFKNNAAGNNWVRKDLIRLHQNDPRFLIEGSSATIGLQISNPGPNELVWRAENTDSRIELLDAKGWLNNQPTTIRIKLSGLKTGSNTVGPVTINLLDQNGNVVDTVYIEVTLFSADKLEHNYLPFVHQAPLPPPASNPDGAGYP